MLVRCPPALRRCRDDGRLHFCGVGGHLPAILCVLLPVADRGVRETAAVPGGAGGYGHTACCLGRRFQTGHAALASLPRAAGGSQRDSGSWRLFPITESCSLNCGSMDSFYAVLDGLRAGPLYLFRSYRPRAAYLLWPRNASSADGLLIPVRFP